jgi:hypothetical protein
MQPLMLPRSGRVAGKIILNQCLDFVVRLTLREPPSPEICDLGHVKSWISGMLALITS